jgi:hypothetical protein
LSANQWQKALPQGLPVPADYDRAFVMDDSSTATRLE